MCGFVGFTNYIGDNGTVLNEMMDRIVHRGPDSAGKFVDSNIALGFRRLSIIDLNSGHQPMFNEDKSLCLVFNGEIYNYKALREELVASGHTFANSSDSEVLLHGFEEWGERLLDRLRGMFAFVIYDLRDNSLFGARDIFGIKPFYYGKFGESLIFASEIKGFFPHPEFKKELDEEALGQYLSFQYSPCEETFFKNVYTLLPAHYFTYKEGKMERVRYWKPEFEEQSGVVEYFADLIDKAVSESVEAHKIADVEVGSFLSSGIDSSYIANTARVDKTFTVGFDAGEDNRYNEIDYAKDFAKQANLNNISKVITKEEYWDTLPKIQYHMDEPLADPSAVALYFVSRLASEHVKVVMSGEGADELFGGYKIYREPITLTLYDRIPFRVRRVISRICEQLPKVRGINYLIRRGKTLEERFIGNANIFSVKERNALLKSDAAKNIPTPEFLCQKHYNQVSHKDAVTKMQYLDINMWLRGDILLKADKMSMANSLELRVPFLDKNIMKLAETLPLNSRVNTETTKIALRKAAAGSIPEFTANKEKLGFPVPIRVWLTEEEYYQKVKSAFEGEIASKYFNTEKLVELLDRHKSGKEDLSRKIWTVYTFLVWYEAMDM